MSIDQGVGRIGRNSASEIADKAARIIMETSKARAVCLAPDGRVTIESAAQAIPDELVGVYTKEPGLIALWRQIYADLRHSIEERGIKPQRSYRKRVPGSRRKEAA